jgi:hypothetical protein
MCPVDGAFDLRQGGVCRIAHMKRLRFSIFNVTGRVVRDRRKFNIRLSASRPWIQKMLALFEAFPLVTQATG